jgi:hypothetical protein
MPAPCFVKPRRSRAGTPTALQLETVRARWLPERRGLAGVCRRQQRAALAIQTGWRRHKAQAAFLRYRRGVVAAQCRWRVKLARRELRRRRKEKNDQGKLLQDKKALEERVAELGVVLENVQNQRNELKQSYKVRGSERMRGRVASMLPGAPSVPRPKLFFWGHFVSIFLSGWRPLCLPVSCFLEAASKGCHVALQCHMAAVHPMSRSVCTQAALKTRGFWG